MDRVQHLSIKRCKHYLKAFWFIIFTFFIVYFGVEMLEQSVKLSRLIIFYFISSFLIYAPILPNRSQKPVLFAVFSFLEQFFSSSTVVLVAKADVLQMPTIAVFAQNWSRADFAPFRWRIWLALSEFLCLLANQNVTFVTLFCTKLPFFCTVLPKNCISLSQSQWRNFFMYIISILNFCCPEMNLHCTWSLFMS